jgi:predicted nucleic acid-binding protein
MPLTHTQLGAAVSSSKLGRYNIVILALAWIEANKQNEDFKKLTAAELINKALNDVVTNVATYEKIEELRKKMKKEPNNETIVAAGRA